MHLTPAGGAAKASGACRALRLVGRRHNVTAGKAGHNSSNVRGVTACKVGRNSSMNNLGTG